MANTKLMVLCIVLVLGQQSLGLSLSLGSLLKKVGDQQDKLGDAARSLIAAVDPSEEDSIEIDDIVDGDELGNEVIQKSEEELEEEAGSKDEVVVDEQEAGEEVEKFDIVTKIESILKNCRAAKRIGLKQLEAINTLIQLINETKTEKSSAPVGEDLTTLPKNCKEVLQKGNTASGLYTIGLPTGLLTKPKAVRVFCDMETDGGGWMVIQRRQDGSQNFKLGWAQYMNGFGDLNNEFWLGNRALNLISTSQVNELRVDMTDGEGVSKYAKYANFQVGSEADKFRLTIGGYTGDAGDSLSARHNGQKFSTIDQDNDTWPKNCAIEFKGAWWYSACHSSNLNGQYLNGAHKTFADGIEWHKWHGYNYSIQFTEMKIRPVA